MIEWLRPRERSINFVESGNQVITSIIKLQVRGALGGQDVHHASGITDSSRAPLVGHDHVLPWGSSVHLYAGDCWLEIPSGGVKAQFMVTTSNRLLVNVAEFGDGPEVEGDVLAAKRSDEDEDTSGGGTDGKSGASASTGSDAESIPEKRRRRGAHYKPRPPRKNTPPAFIQLSAALQPELRKLQHVAAGVAGVSRAAWDEMCKAASKAISSVQPGSRTAVVVATFTCIWQERAARR